MVGIPLFMIGIIVFINGLVNFNIVIAAIGGLLLIIAEILLKVTQERVNNATRR